MLVADSAQIFREGVRELLTRETGFDVVEAADQDAVRELLDAGCPDIALIDVDLAPAGGVACVAELASRCSTQMVVWGFTPSRENVIAAIGAGARGFLPKDIPWEGLIRALRAAEEGEVPLPRELVAVVVDEVRLLEQRATARELTAALSTREREVLELLATGAANRGIARILYISELTAKRHVQNILRKLDVSSRRDAAAVYQAAYGREARVPALLSARG